MSYNIFVYFEDYERIERYEAGSGGVGECRVLSDHLIIGKGRETRTSDYLDDLIILSPT